VTGRRRKLPAIPQRAPTGRNAIEVRENDYGVLLLRNVKLPFRVAEGEHQTGNTGFTAL
jgi:hypothetical protein